MATIELIILLTVAVLLSSILDQLVPKISSPLIQIGLGVVIAFLAIAPLEIDIDPEVFLVLFIAPLLFLDSMESDKENLWQNKGSILSFAIGLVLVITLSVGFVLHWLVPSIPLAAAFALGAALGPTDAVAVASLKKEAHVAKRPNSILQGEALINDASGVVSFQFAIAAAVTGAFSLVDATESFVFSFFGGIILGALLALVFRWIAGRVHDLGLDNVTFHVLFEISMPFLTFLVCEMVHVSGILGVVTCGIIWSLYANRRVSPYQSRLNIATSSVWRVLSFTLNGIVFVLLGMQLPMAMQSTWDDVYIDNLFVIMLVLAITVLIVGLRFLWALAMIRISVNPETGTRDRISRRTAKEALVTTVGGPKGAITLSIIFSIPFLVADGSAFPQRSLIIFLASGVILCTLLLANFLLPVLAPRTEEETDDDEEQFALAKIEVLRTVIERLVAEEDQHNANDVKTVISRYDARIRGIRDVAAVEPPNVRGLRCEVIDYQSKRLIETAGLNQLDSLSVFTYLRRLMIQKNRLMADHSFGYRLTAFIYMVRTYFVVSRHRITTILYLGSPEDGESMRQVRIAAEGFAVEYLERLVNNPAYPSEIVAKLLIAHERTLTVIDPETEAVPMYERLSTEGVDRIQQKALHFEMEGIRDSYAEGRLTRAQSKEMRDNVNIMLIDLEEHV